MPPPCPPPPPPPSLPPTARNATLTSFTFGTPPLFIQYVVEDRDGSANVFSAVVARKTHAQYARRVWIYGTFYIMYMLFFSYYIFLYDATFQDNDVVNSVLVTTILTSLLESFITFPTQLLMNVALWPFVAIVLLSPDFMNSFKNLEKGKSLLDGSHNWRYKTLPSPRSPPLQALSARASTNARLAFFSGSRTASGSKMMAKARARARVPTRSTSPCRMARWIG